VKIAIDCEFNEFGGDLISMGLVAEDGREWYEVLPCPNPGKWVEDHVIPILGRKPISKEQFQARLQQFLMQFETIHLISDWPEDIKFFCESLITGQGTRLNTPPLQMSIFRFDAESELPHNALSDARGIMKYLLEQTVC